jgi:hypothetical protein
MLGVAYWFPWKHKQAEKDPDSADDGCCEGRNAYEQEAVNSSLHKRVARIDVNTERLEDGCHDKRMSGWRGIGSIRSRNNSKRLQH